MIITGIYSQAENNLITIYIDGEAYIREYPSNYDEALSLIDNLVSMYNSLDYLFIEFKSLSFDETDKLLKLNNQLTEYCNELEDKFLLLKQDTADIERYVINKSKEKRSLLAAASFGIVSFLNGAQYSAGIGILYKVPYLTNWYAGLNIPLTIVPQQGTLSVGISLSCGVFIH
jgi:hypothetical protein